MAEWIWNQGPNEYRPETLSSEIFSPLCLSVSSEIFSPLYLSASVLAYGCSRTANNLYKTKSKTKKTKAKHRDQHTGNSDTPRCDVINSLREFVQSLIPTSLQFPSLWASCGCTFLALIQKDAPRHPALSPHSPLRPIGPDLQPPGSSGSLGSHTGPGSKSLCEGRSPWEARGILPVSPRTRFRQHPQPAPSSSPESC